MPLPRQHMVLAEFGSHEAQTPSPMGPVPMHLWPSWAPQGSTALGDLSQKLCEPGWRRAGVWAP